MLITPPARPFIVPFSHFGFFPPSSAAVFSLSLFFSLLLRIFSRVARARSLSPSAVVAAATACNGLKGLHSNNRETNCRALARYRARAGRTSRAPGRSYITVAFVTATCLCFRLVFAILLHRLTRLPPSSLDADLQTSSAGVCCRRTTSRTLFE